ncbi:hypothetical protein GCWU000282_01843 [Catonella morbi ATCC 51271]|uniref:Uncharacterized protein n=1 Tax=Catonella morbi ATCC 51271 TaxID=592026 RepID=V2Y4F3_9FIRM|nr:hypothetical protein GCWU000282_01843 [Catonella morbi ATCC 51271]
MLCPLSGFSSYFLTNVLKSGLKSRVFISYRGFLLISSINLSIVKKIVKVFIPYRSFLLISCFRKGYK